MSTPTRLPPSTTTSVTTRRGTPGRLRVSTRRWAQPRPVIWREVLSTRTARARPSQRSRRTRDHQERFRDRAWCGLALAVPVVISDGMFAGLLHYTLPANTGPISPVLGTVMFLYGRWPFLTGALVEVRSRQPRMMLLVATTTTIVLG